jgi:ribonuclease P protein component
VAERPTGGRSPKRRRLSRSAEFERVYRQGRSKANRFLVLYAFPREDEGRPAGAGNSAAGAADGEDGSATSGASRSSTPPAGLRAGEAARMPSGDGARDVTDGAPASGRRRDADFSLSDHGDGPRLGLSVSRRVGGAVDRSRVKRVLREAFWAEAERLPDGSDYVVVARPDARELAEREGMPGVRTALAELVDALGGAEARHS